MPFASYEFVLNICFIVSLTRLCQAKSVFFILPLFILIFLILMKYFLYCLCLYSVYILYSPFDEIYNEIRTTSPTNHGSSLARYLQFSGALLSFFFVFLLVCSFVCLTCSFLALSQPTVFRSFLILPPFILISALCWASV